MGDHESATGATHSISGMSAEASGYCTECETEYRFQFYVHNAGEPIGPMLYCPCCGEELHDGR